MLRILGSPKSLCDRVPRREFLQAGGLGVLGLSLAELLRADEARRARRAPSAALPSFGKASSCIVLYLYGSPSQLETFDVKPDAPLEIRGELGSIATAIPGFRIGELLPQTAQVLHKSTIVRSMTHPYPVHGIAYATTGLPNPEGQLEVAPRDPRHWPFVGSVVDFLDQQRGGGVPAIPRNLALPFPLSTRRTGQPFRAGPYGGFLGPAYDPTWTEFHGRGTKSFTQENRGLVQEFRDPYGGVEPDCCFQVSAAATLAGEMTVDRLSRRKTLLAQLDQARREAEASHAAAGYDRSRQTAFSLLTSNRLAEAINLHAEPMSTRERYGMTLFGQGALAARRLVEAGGRLVSVFWDEFGLADSAWDTHYQHYARMKNELCPSFDRAYSGLLGDLDERGLLEETLVVCLSEHGRTPKLTAANGGGRDHWSRAYSAIFAGGGFAAGAVVGKTDRFAGDVVNTPISPKDVLATVYHLLGIDPETVIHDSLGRPFPIAGSGRVRTELLA